MVQQLLFLQLLVLLTLRKGAHNRSLFQGHFFKAREPTYPRVRIKINKMIFFSLFLLHTCLFLKNFSSNRSRKFELEERFQRSRQGRTFLGLGGGQRTALMASSNTVLRPFCVSAEHSRYLTAPTSLAIDRPWKTNCEASVSKGPKELSCRQCTFIGVCGKLGGSKNTA